MDSNQGCWFCCKPVCQENHFCSLGCFHDYHEAEKRLTILEHDLKTIEADLESLDRRIEQFDEVANQVHRLRSNTCSNDLKMLHVHRDEMSSKARSLQHDVACLQQWMGAR
jgi:hypothetical protein